MKIMKKQRESGTRFELLSAKPRGKGGSVMGESWIKKDGPEGDIVLGTRIRLARNFAEIPFPAVANREQARQVLQQASSFL